MGVKQNVSHLKIFGCIAFAQVPLQKRLKLEDKSERCVVLGYCLETKTYKLFNPITAKVILSRDVVFKEDEHWDWSFVSKSSAIYAWEDPFIVDQDDGETKDESQGNSTNSMASQDHSSQYSIAFGLNPQPFDELEAVLDGDTLPRKTRQLSDIYSNYSFSLSVIDPMSFKEAVKLLC